MKLYSTIVNWRIFNPKSFYQKESTMETNEEMNEDCSCEFGLLSSSDTRNGFFSGATFTDKPVVYSVVDGLAVFEGCIILGTADEMEANTARVMAGEDIQETVVISGQKYRWPNCLMPYTIDSNLPSANKQRITDAMSHWTQKTGLKFTPRTSQANYVHFRPASGCWSYVGMRGGKQEIGLAGGCGFGATVHEIGHAWGLWHEQSREDRNSKIKVLWQNIIAGREHNFNQHISDGDDIGAYDYGSIMHYSRLAFSKNGQPTIESIPPGKTLGQRNGLSTSDISGIKSIYDCKTWVTKKVLRTFSSPHNKNAWANLQGIGWRKAEPKSADGVANMFLTLCEAKVSNMNVRTYIDNKNIFQVYL
jgi:hypothetical protein